MLATANHTIDCIKHNTQHWTPHTTYCTGLHQCTGLHHTAQNSNALQCTILRRTALHRTVMHCTLLRTFPAMHSSLHCPLQTTHCPALHSTDPCTAHYTPLHSTHHPVHRPSTGWLTCSEPLDILQRSAAGWFTAAPLGGRHVHYCNWGHNHPAPLKSSVTLEIQFSLFKKYNYKIARNTDLKWKLS